MKRLALIYLLAFLAGCNDDNDAIPQGDPIFTFEVSDDVLFDYEYWIVLRDSETGELIDSQSIPFGGPAVEFRTDKTISGKLSVTLLKADMPYDVKIYVYNDIDVGTKWHISYPFPGMKVAPDRSSQSLPFVINNVPNMYGFGSSDLFGQNIEGNLNFLDNKITGSVSFHEGSTRQMFVVDDGNMPKYKFVDEPAPGAQINLNYSDLVEFDDYMYTSFPLNSEIKVNVYAVDTAQNPINSYLLYGRELSLPAIERDFLRIGFLDQFKTYMVDAIIGPQYFHSVGDAPKFIDYIGPENFVVSMNSVSDFSITTQYQYTYAKTLYMYSTHRGDVYTSYQLYYYTTPENQKHFDPLTPELAQQYSVSSSRFTFDNTEVHWWRGRFYQDAISYGFDPRFDILKPAQEAWVVVRPPFSF